jgi:hypothetical protein
MADFIKLGTSGTALRDYQLLDQSNYVAQLANPFAAQINTQSEYGELESYSEWVVDDWQAGVGKRRPDAGGALYAHMDTRFPNQMIMPMGWNFPYKELSAHSGSDYAAGDLTVDGTTITKASTSFLMPAVSRNIMAAWVYMDAADGTTITLDIYSDSGYAPNASALTSTGTGTVTKNRPGPVWVKAAMDGTVLTASTRYHFVVSGSASLTLPKITPSSGEYAYTYNGTSWTASATGFQFLTGMVSITNNLGLESDVGDSLIMEDGNEFELVAGDDGIGWVVKADGKYFAAYNNRVIELHSDGTVTERVNTGVSLITDLFAFGNKIVIAYGAGYKVYTVSSGVTDTYAVNTDLITIHGGYVWRAYQNDLYYSTDGVTWIQIADTVGPDDYEVRGMAGLNENLYLSTDRGLYALLPGNYIYPVRVWPTTDSRNGRGMVEWNGALYIPLAEDLMRYTEDGSLLQVGLRTGEELPADIQGVTYAMQPTSYFLLASVQANDPDGYGTLWAYNEQGWHGLGLLPQGVSGGAIYLDTSVNPGVLLWGGDYGLLGRAKYPSNVVNPIRDRGEKLFARHGWIEQDRFYGGHVSLDKDWESVYLNTEKMDDATISIYWRDENRTDWELLASSSETDFEERWTLDSGIRPNSKWLRLGLLIRTDNEDNTPIVRAHRTSFHTMVKDRWRWTLGIAISGTSAQKQQMLDGTVNYYTAAQMKAHLEDLITQVPPIVYQDIDGTQYEVKIVQCSRSVMRQEYYNNTANYQYLYNLVIEQVTDGAYS